MVLSRHVATVVSAVFAAALLISAPGTAWAVAPATDMWEYGSVTLADLAPGKAPTFIVTLHLKDKIKLPAKVAVPVPADSAAIWVGEMFFGDPSQDISVDGAELVKDGTDRYLVLEMKTTRSLQVESTVPTAWIDNAGMIRKIDLAYKAPAVAGTTKVAVIVPTGFTAEETPKGAEVLKASDGAAYVKTWKKVKSGQVLAVALTIVQGDPVFTFPTEESTKTTDATSSVAASGTTQSAPTTVAAQAPTAVPPASSPLLNVILGVLTALVLAVAAGIFVLLRKKPSA